MCSAKGRRERNSIEKLLDWVFDTKGNIGERGYGICESWGFYNWFLNKYQECALLKIFMAEFESTNYLTQSNIPTIFRTI